MRTMSGGPCTHYDCTNRNAFGYCKTTACINQDYSTEWIESTANKSYQVVSKPVTNADWIRSMTDEELAGRMITIMQGWCPRKASDCVATCKECLLGWLKQEA